MNRDSPASLRLSAPKSLLSQPLSGHLGLPFYAGAFVDHLAGLGVNLLSRLESDADNLQVVALDLVLDGLNDCWLGPSAGNGSRRGLTLGRPSATVGAKKPLPRLAGFHSSCKMA